MDQKKNPDKNLQLLGLARKAGKLAVGSEDTNSAARTGKARLIITASDASASALRRARSSADMSYTPYLTVPYTSYELGSITGRGSPGTVTFLDAGLAARFVKGLAENDPEKYHETEELLIKTAIAQREKKTTTRSGKGRTNK